MPSNRLESALSPYLLQHADNPVEWYPWSAEALDRARELDRPVLLSIGYSACHWCHVMAHESFSDEAIAARMNRYFVNVKVDREERPDLDRLYQLSHQLLTGRGGGWPLTAFLDPFDHAPFFAGTYFPPRERHGMISFPELLERIHQAWLTRRDELKAQNRQLVQALSMISEPRRSEAKTPESGGDPADALLAQLAARFDREHGGFGGAPKFPQAPLLALLAELADHDEQAAQMHADTLRHMARAGLHDHLAGGFFRYCVDAAWEIPHFEKMLYDNAQLLGLYVDAAVRWEDPEANAAAHGIVAWLQSEMALEGGGFAASLDADTADGEGAFYVWTPDTVDAVLDPQDATLFKARYGLDGPPNFEDRAWHLVVARSLDELTAAGLDRKAVAAMLERTRSALLETRNRRSRPGRDDKLIAGWNGLLITALARAGRLIGKPAWTELAAAALDTVAVRLFGQEPPRAVWRDGRSDHPALLDDHASVLLACLQLLQSRWEDRWFRLALRLADRILDQFVDPDSGALYMTPRDHERLLARPLDHADDAIPAGAGLAVMGLVELGHLTADVRYLDTAARAVEAVSGDMERAPTAHATMIRAARRLDHPPAQVLLGGAGDMPDGWRESLSRRRDVALFRIPGGVTELPDLLDALARVKEPTAQVCLGNRCLAPVHTWPALSEQLEDLGARD